MNSGCIYKTNYVPICSTKVIGYYPPLERNFGKCFSYRRELRFARITCKPRRFSSCFRGYSDSLKVAQENWRCCRGAQMDDAKNDSTIADTSHGVSRCGAIHQLFGRALFPSFLAEFLRLQTKSGKTEDVAQTPPERRWGLPLAR